MKLVNIVVCMLFPSHTTNRFPQRPPPQNLGFRVERDPSLLKTSNYKHQCK